MPLIGQQLFVLKELNRRLLPHQLSLQYLGLAQCLDKVNFAVKLISPLYSRSA